MEDKLCSGVKAHDFTDKGEIRTSLSSSMWTLTSSNEMKTWGFLDDWIGKSSVWHFVAPVMGKKAVPWLGNPAI